MSKIVIGTANGKNLNLDIPLLIPSRLLIQANSGGGKSWLLRRLAEQLYGKVQTIIIDPEGEFYTLREKFGYVLVGEGGETPADVRSAAMLAEKFLTLKANAVCDLYEAFRARPLDRRQWVRIFLNALLDAPRSMWHPLIVIVDEAHKFCPQETPKAGSMTEREIIGGCKDAMIALSTNGRKRGFCAIWATQRLAKVDKDASAELFNRLVGMTIEDVDVDRAADLMSVSKDEKHEFRASLRSLSPGQFYAFGRAITTERKLVKVGDVQTHHPETGAAAKTSEAPPTPDAIKGFLPKLADLPKQAEDKARSEAEYKREIRELNQKVRDALKRAVQAQPPGVIVRNDPRAMQTAVAAATKPLLKQIQDFRRCADLAVGAINGGTAKAVDSLERILGAKVATIGDIPNDYLANVGRPNVSGESAFRKIPPAPKPAREIAEGDGKLRDGAERMLAALCQFYPAGMPEGRLRSHAGLKKSGTYTTYRGDLFRNGYVERRGDDLFATQVGLDYFGGSVPDAPSTTEEVVALWSPKLRDGARRMLDRLIAHGGEFITKEQLFEESALAKSGTATTYLGDLKRAQLAVVGRDGVAANRDTLFLEDAA